MGHLIGNGQRPSKWIRKEIELHETLQHGARNIAVKRAQEWLNLHGHNIAMDRDFGDVTEAAVRAFQRERNLSESGRIDRKTYAELVAPMQAVLQPIDPGEADFTTVALNYARAHLLQHPLEVGGQNCGPWVRLYARGNEGRSWPWCAHFVTFIMRQAAETLGVDSPIKGSGSCDTLTAQAREADRFIPGRELNKNKASVLRTGGLFLIRRTSTDWVHTGFLTRMEPKFFHTVEGNTNDEGSREGFEVCRRTRGYRKMDFVALS